MCGELGRNDNGESEHLRNLLTESYVRYNALNAAHSLVLERKGGYLVAFEKGFKEGEQSSGIDARREGYANGWMEGCSTMSNQEGGLLKSAIQSLEDGLANLKAICEGRL